MSTNSHTRIEVKGSNSEVSRFPDETLMTTAVAPTHLFEKYRPRRIAECVLLPRDRTAFESFIARGNAPHILLIGPPGVGKTSVAAALANDMNWQVLKKNAAAYANVEAVRPEIAQFALPPSHLPLPFSFENEDQRHHCVFLDEGDHMPAKAQAALRGVMEDAAESAHANFIMTANEPDKVDRAIRSRCATFDFAYSDPAERKIITAAFRQRIVKIIEAEGLQPDQPMVDRLMKKFGLDFRAALNEIEKHPLKGNEVATV